MSSSPQERELQVPTEQAIPFIVYDQKEGFCLNKDAEAYLSSLPDDRKVGLISIVGKYRTGKSFFVNRVLLDRGKNQTGFQVGPTINPCTKGLWLWRKELKSSEDENMDILLIDTEGFGGMDENVNHDSRIFLFSLLLSSYFIYNSQGSIDENALNSLSLIINLAKDIQVSATPGVKGGTTGASSNDGFDDAANHFPSFLWVIRDFALQIVDSLGNKISQKDYLEKALELQKGVSDAVESKNRIRKLMKHFFKERDCCTLVRPVEQERDLQRLNEIANEDLRPEFNEEVTALRRKIFKRVKPKTLGGRTLNGRMLVEICKAYTEAINKGNLPNIENAWTYVKKNESQKAFEKSISVIDSIIFAAEQQPLDPSQIESFKESMRTEAIRVLKKNAISEDDDLQEFFSRIDERIADKLREFKKQNKLQWQRKYAEMFSERVRELEGKLMDEEYSDFYEFSADLNTLRSDFERETPAKDSMAKKFFTEVSERLHRLAAEKVGAKKDREVQKQLRQSEVRLAARENELEVKKNEFERERIEQEGKASLLHSDIAQLRASETLTQQKMLDLQDEIDRISKVYKQFQTSAREDAEQKERDAAKRVRDLEVSIDSVKNEYLKKHANNEKTIALLEQETSFKSREIKSLQEKIAFLEAENKKIHTENTSLLSVNDRLKHQLEEATEQSNREMGLAKSEFERKVCEITSESDKKKEMIKQQSDFAIEKGYLENQVAYYKSQLEENKKLHDALLIALQCMNNKEDHSSKNAELTEENRGLSSNITKLQARCGEFEAKIAKLILYKNQVKSSSALQCLQCSKLINSKLFEAHLAYPCVTSTAMSNNTLTLNSSSCNHNTNNNNNNNQSNLNSKTSLMQSNSISSINCSNVLLASNSSINSSFNLSQQQNLLTLDATQLSIEVSENVMRESIDSQVKIIYFSLSVGRRKKKSRVQLLIILLYLLLQYQAYTEYLIEVTYMKHCWQVARQFKDFCELHAQLVQTFNGSGVKFPESSKAVQLVVGGASEGASLIGKRSDVVDDRMKALQDYLCDLASIDALRNSKPFMHFLDAERNSLTAKVKDLTHARNNTSIQLSSSKAAMFASQSQLQHSDQELMQQQTDSQSRLCELFPVSTRSMKLLGDKQLVQSPASFLKSLKESKINKENQPRTATTLMNHGGSSEVITVSTPSNRYDTSKQPSTMNLQRIAELNKKRIDRAGISFTNETQALYMTPTSQFVSTKSITADYTPNSFFH